MRTKIVEIEKFSRTKMSGEATGHDYFHVDRVRKIALKIAGNYKKSDRYIVEAASLMHDLGDWKTNNSGKSEEEILKEACTVLKIPLDDQEKILSIILNMSFSANVGDKKKLSLEGKIVQDADRLEALGAIGIARAFAYGGRKGRELYNPGIKPKKIKSTAEYKNSTGPSINHFYEKLFLIRASLNTPEAKKIAATREQFMKKFLKEFYNEWEVKI